jgi:hypothetical protein
MGFTINPKWRKSMKKIIKVCIAAAFFAVSLFTVTSCSQNIADDSETQAEEQTVPTSEENAPARCIFGGISGGTYGPSSYSSGN